MSLRRVEIAVRVRASENPRDVSCVTLDQHTRRIRVASDGGAAADSSSAHRSYREDLLFDEHVSNKEIFDELVLQKMRSTSPREPDTLCFFAYGHTSSGKTHTIAGSDDEPGVLRLCVEELLRREGVVEVSMLEVYMDAVHDLLSEGEARPIRRRQGPQGGPVIVVEGLTTCSLTSVEQWKAVSAYGMRSRRTAPTERNARSSRSHAIFTIKSRSVRLCLVDLAGSERQTVFSPQLNRESISINKSLSRLSTVLEALSSQRVTEDGKRTYVNFRDTTLTVLLQRYLTGASLTTFLACVHPGVKNCQETLSTLRYTQRLKRIRTRGADAVHPAEWSGLKPVEHQALLDELMQLREACRRSEDTSRLVEAAQQRRIAELEHTLAAQQHQRTADSSSRGGIAGDRVRDTRRVAGWLLSRVLGELPELNVGYDDYFDGLLPTSVQVIGYVSTMAGLVPRTAGSDPLAFLDVGDIAMGLSMLDAGIPPFVRLHEAGCTEPAMWEGHAWEEDGREGVVYVLAFFEYHRTAMTAATAAGDEGSAEALPCCGGFVTSSSLLPIATVLCVPATATRAMKEVVLQRLIDLQCEQHEAVGPQSSAAASSSASLHTSPRSQSEYALPAAAELLDASLIEAEGETGGMNGNGGHADTSLLAQEVRRQATDVSHLVTPFKESSSTTGSSRCSSVAAVGEEGEGKAEVRPVNVRRDLLAELADFDPAAAAAAAAPATAVPSKQPPSPPAASQEEPTANISKEAPAPPASPPRTQSPPPAATAAAPARPQPPPSPPSASTPPTLSKRPKRDEKGKDKTARAHGCSGCHVL